MATAIVSDVIATHRGTDTCVQGRRSRCSCRPYLPIMKGRWSSKISFEKPQLFAVVRAEDGGPGTLQPTGHISGTLPVDQGAKREPMARIARGSKGWHRDRRSRRLSRRLGRRSGPCSPRSPGRFAGSSTGVSRSWPEDLRQRRQSYAGYQLRIPTNPAGHSDESGHPRSEVV